MEAKEYQITAIEIPSHADWAGLMRSFAGASPIPMRQAWLEAPEADFRAGFVRLGWMSDTLHVLAELEDTDIFNPETRFTELAFRCGDVFEIFLRPAAQRAYFELHVTPCNQRLQLRIPSVEAFREARATGSIPEEWKINGPLFESRTRVEAAENRWRVHARIPAAHIREVGARCAGERWLVSFSRYDYTRGREMPVLSSTSAHLRPDFHRQEEWLSVLIPFEG